MKIVKAIWGVVVVIVLLFIVGNLGANLPNAQSAMQASQLYNEATTVILGIIAFTLVLFLWDNSGSRPTAKKDEQEEEETTEKIERGEIKTCPYCAEIIKAGAIFCKHCGKDVSAVLPDFVKCPLCGEDLGLDGKERIEKKFVCDECGKLVDMTKPNSSIL